MDHANPLNWLSAIRLPHHIQSDQRAQQLRNQKYIIQMSQPGFDLFVGWLSEGVGGEVAGSGDGFLGEQGKRGRAAVMLVVNNHLDFNGNSLVQTSAVFITYQKCSGVHSCRCLDVGCELGRIYRSYVFIDPSDPRNVDYERPSSV